MTILIIEDNPGDFLLIRDYLEEQFSNPTVLHAKKYAEAIEMLSRPQNAPDVVLLDLTLPDSAGEKLITGIVEHCPRCPVIVLTGFGDLEFSIRSLSLRVSDYLLKDDIDAISLHKSIVYNIERKKTGMMLEESEKRYSNLFQLSPQPMWIMDSETFAFVQVNQAFSQLYGYSENESLKMSLFDILNEPLPDEPAKRISQVKAISLSDDIYKGRHQHRKKSGDLMEVDIYSTQIRINDKPFLSMISIDVTEKVRMEYHITKAIIQTQEDERLEIGTELHDNVCQILASSLLSLDMLNDRLLPESEQWHRKSIQFINLALDEIRNISHRLAPSFFDESTIESTFRELLDNFNVKQQYDITLDIDFTFMKSRLNTDLQLNLYRILQEQMRNIVKYAEATQLRIACSEEDGHIRFTVADNGVGFDISTVKKGIGLANIRRRAELFNGSMDIDSCPGQGCTLHIRIPVTN